ncbi:hypothetical protein AWV80_11925 [Cupriavidus sp. UYMU48A]|nr:hypothetical protein AWV80_11925 [Cupriavidus sp. UYMU48A]
MATESNKLLFIPLEYLEKITSAYACGCLVGLKLAAQLPCNVVPRSINEAQSNICIGDRSQFAWHIMMPGNMQTSVAQVGQSWT